MRGKRGTKDCEQCAKTRWYDAEHTLRQPGFRDSDKWEDEPCIDLKKTWGYITVSTVFLHHDHNFSSNHDPIFYETIIFDGWYSDDCGEEIYCNRYSSKQEAITKHNIIVSFLDKQTPEEFVAWVKLIREESKV